MPKKSRQNPKPISNPQPQPHQPNSNKAIWSSVKRTATPVIHLANDKEQPCLRALQKKVRNLNKKLNVITELSYQKNLTDEQLQKCLKKVECQAQRDKYLAFIQVYQQIAIENKNILRSNQLVEIKNLSQLLVAQQYGYQGRSKNAKKVPNLKQFLFGEQSFTLSMKQKEQQVTQALSLIANNQQSKKEVQEYMAANQDKVLVSKDHQKIEQGTKLANDQSTIFYQHSEKDPQVQKNNQIRSEGVKLEQKISPDSPKNKQSDESNKLNMSSDQSPKQEIQKNDEKMKIETENEVKSTDRVEQKAEKKNNEQSSQTVNKQESKQKQVQNAGADDAQYQNSAKQTEQSNESKNEEQKNQQLQRIQEKEQEHQKEEEKKEDEKHNGEYQEKCKNQDKCENQEEQNNQEYQESKKQKKKQYKPKYADEEPNNYQKKNKYRYGNNGNQYGFGRFDVKEVKQLEEDGFNFVGRPYVKRNNHRSSHYKSNYNNHFNNNRNYNNNYNRNSNYNENYNSNRLQNSNGRRDYHYTPHVDNNDDDNQYDEKYDDNRNDNRNKDYRNNNSNYNRNYNNNNRNYNNSYQNRNQY